MSEKKNGKKFITKENQRSFKEIFDSIISYRHLGIVIAAAYFVVLLIVSLTYHKVGDYGVETDFFWAYVPEAKSFLGGHLIIDQFRGPLYPMTLGLFYLIIGDYFYAGIIIGIISAIFVIYFTFELIKRIFTPAVAFFVTLLLTFNPIFVQFTYSAGTDMFFNALVTAALFFFLKNKELNYINIILAAIFGGLSYLTRYNGIFLLGFIVVILFVNFWKIDWIKRIKVSLLFVSVFALTFTMWGVYCLSEKGSFFYNENYKNIAYELYGKGAVPWDQFWFEESKEFNSISDVINKDAEKFFSNIARNIGSHFLSDTKHLVGWYTGVLSILGILLLLFRNPVKYWKTRENGYYISNIFFFGLLLLIFYSERFSLFLIPFYLVLAVQPFFRNEFKLFRHLPKAVGYIVLLIISIITLSYSISFNSSKINSGPKELLILRDWYAKNIPYNERGKKIAARKPHVAYYLNMDFNLFPMADSYKELIAELQKNKVDYLYVGTYEVAHRRKFEFLLNPQSEHPGLKVIYSSKSPDFVLYKIE
ncbi:hypothetical protein BMS3Abin03_02488 [bacterium BMS3Abin03]|nr:hypothetical protein BMS3Abin03_02488 [bacterium BMS3Abin03]